MLSSLLYLVHCLSFPQGGQCVEIFWHVVIFGGIIIAMVILGSFKGVELIGLQLSELINALKWNLSVKRLIASVTNFYEVIYGLKHFM